MFLKEVAKKRSQLLQAVPKCGVEVINVLEHMNKLVNGFHLNFNTIALGGVPRELEALGLHI
jgi:hypothetical protein